MNYLKYKEKELPIKIDFGTIKNTSAKLNLKLSQFELVLDNLDYTSVLFFESLKRGFKLEGKVFDISEAEAEEILAENYADFLMIVSQEVLKVFTPKSKQQTETTIEEKKR